MKRVAIFDDHQIIVDQIEAKIKAEALLETSIVTTDHQLLIKQINEENTDILISDILTEDDIGLSIFEEVRKAHPNIKIIAYTGIKNEFVKTHLKEIGVLEIVSKTKNVDFLVQRIHALKDDDANIQKKTTKHLPKLTPQEKTILEYLGKGYFAKEIAAQLGTSVHTVNNQKNKLLKKYNCDSSTELIIKLNQMGLISNI